MLVKVLAPLADNKNQFTAVFTILGLAQPMHGALLIQCLLHETGRTSQVSSSMKEQAS